MRRVRLDRAVSPGAALAHEVIGPAGEIIARVGYPLHQRGVEALLARGVTWCYVEDAASAGIVLRPIDGGGGAVRAILRSVWSRVAEAAEPYATMHAAQAIAAIRRAQPTAAIRLSAPYTLLPEAAASLVVQAQATDPRGGFVTARQAPGDEEGHALGVAALSARIASVIGLDAADILKVVTAALLHDIGMICVPERVRRTRPALWTPPQRRRYEDHAAFGAALLEPLADPSLHFAVVAGEHHEAQDGSGYPGGAVSGNRVLRNAEERRDPGRIALFAEIVAVADQYERLLSPSPGYAGRSPAAARLLLAGAAGAALNREVVTRFLDAFPALPLASEVRLEGGPLPGAYAIVCSVPGGPETPPRVRLFADPDGRPIEPAEIDLAGHATTRLVPVDDAAEDAA